MLTHITVNHFVIVRHLELTLIDGMTALTGETGAGKSILIDALNLVLGDRADPLFIRTGHDRAEINAHFDVLHCQAAQDWLIAHQLLLTDETIAHQSAELAAHHTPLPCHIRRILIRGGRSRAYINDQPVNTAQLRALGEKLIDIHGQHAHQSLLRPTAQRDLLDEYAGQLAFAAEVAASYSRYRELITRWERLNNERERREARLELLRFQVAELELLAPTEGELEQLDTEQRRLTNVERLRDTTARLVQLLYDGETTLHDQLSRANNDLSALITLDAQLIDSGELLTSALVQIKEAAANLRQYCDGLEFDPERANEIEERLMRLHDLGRKYRVPPAQLPAMFTQLNAELTQLEQADANLDALNEQCAQAHSIFLAMATQLSAARQAAAVQLSATVTAMLQELGMIGGQFAIMIRAIEPPTAHGLDQVEFQVSANMGQPLQPLAKVASGGELSRISLAIQVATASCTGIPTLIFDEVDVGIGGGVAEIVGRLLRRLATTRQVLCVTHLPQVAAQAHQQLRVIKSNDDGQTVAAIEALAHPQRVDELARMLGGMEITATTRAHAEELLRLIP
ncbi:DNA repair protein RecN [Thiospirillum jenense]|uniref:DNA repair protein RecN n=1 Tax=Thiospirillum jenense TaxID=1653858 RepID=A0A839HDK4_9GAMM|nr:DNA repair protein RecN [Thiospirillum jenense]MBB1126973.1 DNA repair protein RecN [Thiospirillum jenense]